MNKLLALALLLPTLLMGAVRSVSVNENGVLLSPTGLFIINSNELDRAISDGEHTNVTAFALQLIGNTNFQARALFWDTNRAFRVAVMAPSVVASNYNIIWPSNAPSGANTNLSASISNGTNINLIWGPGGGGGGATAFDAIGDPSGDGTIAFGGTQQIITSSRDSAVSPGVLVINNTDADTANDTALISLSFVDTLDANSIFLLAISDSTGAPLESYRMSDSVFNIDAHITTTFLGPTAVPTAGTGNNTTAAASTAFVQATAVASNWVSVAGNQTVTGDKTFTGLVAVNDIFQRFPAKTIDGIMTVTSTNNWTFLTATNFNFSFSGTPVNGQIITLSVSNYNVTADVFGTNAAGIYSPYARSNVTIFQFGSNNVETLEFEFQTNFVAAGFWKLNQWTAREFELEPGSNMTFTTNGATGKITISSTGGGAGGGTNTALFVQTNDVSVANTVTETTILGSGVGSKTIPANYFIPGRNIRGILRGTFSDDTITPGTVRVRVKLGSTTILDTAAQTPASAVTDDYIEIAFDITCRLTGASGTVWGQGYADLSDGLVTTHHLFQMVNSAPVVIDTTASQVLDVTWQWGTADADNSMTNHMTVICEGPGVTIGTDGTVTSIATGTGLTGGTITTSGTITMADMAALSVKTRAVNSSGAPGDLAAGVDGQYLKRTNSTLIFGVIPDADLPTTMTVKTFTQGATAGGLIKLSEDTDNGANVISLKAPDTVASDKIATFPDLTGTVMLDATVIQDSITVPMGAWFTNNLVGAHPSGASSLSFSNVSDSFEFSSTQTITNGIRLLCALPINWDAGVIRMGIRALCVNTNDPSATNVVWSVRAAAIKDNDDATAPTYGTAIAVTNAVAKQANLSRACITRDITVGNTPAATNTIAFEISRLTADTGDTLTNSGLRMLETIIYYKRTSNAIWPVPSL